MKRGDRLKMSLGDTAPTDDELRVVLEGLAGELDCSLNGGGPPEIGFILLLFPFGMQDGGQCHYLSNGKVSKDVELLAAQVRRFRLKLARPQGQA